MGNTISSVFTHTFPPAPRYSVDDIPDLTGKVAIVTGANTGVGKETVKALLAHNAKVYLAARSEDKAQAAIDDLRKQTGKEASFLKLDLADLKSVKAAALEFQGKEKELHILFNNGGVMAPPVDQLTADGYDLQMGTNVLGHFYFTKLLLPTLISTAKASPEEHVRVVTTSSMMHFFGSLNFNTFKDGPARRRLSPSTLYCQSKYGNIVFAAELARRYGDQGVVSTSLHPGVIRSDLWRYTSKFESWVTGCLMYSPAYGALTQLWGGTSKEGAELNGKYLIPWARIGSPRRDALDPVLGKQLWEWLEEQVQNI
ncbi:putative NAD-P-binding protein [Lyophyllum shimeji]|uniref:NAD-P-binding protein n=1 Tax=Lyophyllum shimeji TaxID=47721 RepID=A0A9P3PW78_LYOSH|nr:putative NAD-P-binding protein [Lyophyllum shimeji]